MIAKLATLGALGYAGYRWLQRRPAAPDVRLAGGPLSQHATVQASADQPPADDPYRDRPV